MDLTIGTKRYSFQNTVFTLKDVPEIRRLSSNHSTESNNFELCSADILVIMIKMSYFYI